MTQHYVPLMLTHGTPPKSESILDPLVSIATDPFVVRHGWQNSCESENSDLFIDQSEKKKGKRKYIIDLQEESFSLQNS